jgi:hypothetical protein
MNVELMVRRKKVYEASIRFFFTQCIYYFNAAFIIVAFYRGRVSIFPYLLFLVLNLAFSVSNSFFYRERFSEKV